MAEKPCRPVRGGGGLNFSPEVDCTAEGPALWNGDTEGKKPAHCDVANKWQNCGLQQSLYPEPPHAHHAVPFTKNAFHFLNC